MQDRTQQIVQRMIEAGESEQDIAAVIQQLQAKPKTREEQFDEATAPIHRLMRGDPAERPKTIPDMLATGVSLLPQTKFLGAAKGIATHGPRIVSNLVQRFPRLANAAIRSGGAAGAGGVGSLLRSGMDDTPESMGDVATNAALEMGKQGGLELLGPGMEHGGRWVARTGMNRALGPSKAASIKYGDLPSQALDRRVLVSEGGANKMESIREAAQGRKVDAINNARPVSILTNPIKRGAAGQTVDTAVGQQIAGMRPTMAPSHVVDRFGGGRPGISLPESELAKRQLDNAADAAHQAKRMGKRPSLGDAERIALSREILESQDQIVPGMRGMNREISQSMGLEQAIKQRVAQPGSGLADEAALMGSMVDPRIALSRIIREPQALSAFSILVNELSKGGKVAPAALRSLLVTSRDR